MKSSARVVLLLIVSTLSACGNKEAPPAAAPAPVATAPVAAPEPEVSSVVLKQIMLVKQLGTDANPAAEVTEFGINDSFFAIVETTGSGKAGLKVIWSQRLADRLLTIGEAAQDQVVAGPTANEFRIDNANGWPVGDYQVEVLVNGKSSAVQKFAVK